MKEGTLYDKKGSVGTYNISVEMEDTEFEKMTYAELGSEIIVKVKAVKGFTGNDPQVFLKKEYEQLFVEGITLDNVEIELIDSTKKISSKGDLFPKDTFISIKGTSQEN